MYGINIWQCRQRSKFKNLGDNNETENRDSSLYTSDSESEEGKDYMSFSLI